MSPQFTSLVEKLKEIFQIDKPELDFGIYRILRARREQIEDFLNNRLAAKVQAILAGNAAAEEIALKNALEEAIENARQLGIDDPTVLPKVRELKEKLAACSGSLQAENEVYSHLLTFFSRYYDKGDFISQRRYKGDTYAIPYSGEEVKLHWANADQYYVKSGESFSNYDFTLPDGGKVHFRLVSAELTKDNIKDNDAVRCFVLWDPSEAEGEEPGSYPAAPLEEKAGELYVYFQYRRFKKGTKQKEKSDAATTAFFAALSADVKLFERFAQLDSPAPTEKDKHRKLFRKYLDAYTAKNTSDYFIHKDLQGFLARELDFYIKNEMMHLDDIQYASAFSQIEKNLRMIQAVRAIATELIVFMAQIENFQKKLWLKKKFVVQCDYCLTMNLVPQELHAEVLANPRQLEEWRKLNTTEASLITDARMVDTRFFDEAFKAKLLSSIENLDERCDGLLIHSENFGALRLIKTRYERDVDAIYIDPPYNTGNDGFLYKDAYKHSSWLSMIVDRLALGSSFSTERGALVASIDEIELVDLHKALDITWGADNFIADIIWAAGRKNDSRLVSVSHEYMVCYARSKALLDACKIEWRQKKKGLDDIYAQYAKLKKRYGEDYAKITQELKLWYKSLPDSDPAKAHKHYSCVDARGIYFPADISWPGGGGPTYEVLHPVTKKPVKMPARGWVYASPERMAEMIAVDMIHFGEDEQKVPCVKSYLKDNEYAAPYSVLYKDGRAATKRLRHILGMSDFGYPKDETVIAETISSWTENADLFMDYFAGSGTTAHAVINLNREDGGNRKYILVEMGDHFNAVLMPRIKKVAFSPDWKDGKPVTADKGVSHCFKYMRLESYEDTLNNIELQEARSGDMYDTMMQDQYLLKYMLDIESRGSIINTDSFRKPFDYCLKIAVDSSGASESRKVDLVETFNYLLGIRVESQERHIDKGYILIEGKMKNGAAVLIVWRDCDKIGSAELNNLLEKKGIRPGDSEFATIYVNGDHSIANKKLGSEDDAPELKVRSIEEEFLTRMFEGE